MRFITDLMKYFTFITTGITIVFFIQTMISKVETVPVIMIGEIPAAGLVTALITVILLRKEPSTKKGSIIIFTIHFVMMNIIMVAFGLLFDWISPAPLSILSMILCVAFVYAFTFATAYFTSKKDADEINTALKEQNNISNKD